MEIWRIRKVVGFHLAFLSKPSKAGNCCSSLFAEVDHILPYLLGRTLRKRGRKNEAERGTHCRPRDEVLPSAVEDPEQWA